MTMEMGHNKPRNLDYVHFTRVDNSAFITSSPAITSGANASPSSSNIFTKVKMMSPQVGMKVVIAAVLVAVVLTVIITVTVALTIANRRLQSEKMTSTEAQVGLTTVETILETWTSSTEQYSVSSSSSSSTEQSSISSSPSSSSTLTTAKSTASPCRSSEFLCSDMTCISLKSVCNGVTDCPDGEDESISCACTADQFRCPSGQCVPSFAVCNEVYDCLDKGDEMNCPDCRGFRCKSNNLCLWDRMTRRCNQVFDCDDYSDEKNCSRRAGRKSHSCSNGVQIPVTSVCDGLDDCGDNSDELSCTCNERRQFACSDTKGRCISLGWVCDGHPDCQDGADEKGCDLCVDGQFQCSDYTCVNSSLHCDGKVDCAVSGGDEDGCVELTRVNELQLMVEGNLLPVCADGWTDDYSSWACSSLQTRAVLSWTSEPAPSRGSRFAVINDPQSEVNIGNFRTTDACQSQAIVHIQCQEPGCGERKIDVMESFVAGGNVAGLGKWPWVVSLAYLGKPICGGVLIGTRWALTAAHCIMFPTDRSQDYSKTPSYFTVTAGAVTISSNTTITKPHIDLESLPLPQVVRVSKIIYHPKQIVLDNGGVDWDMVLLQLESDVRMSDLVQPVCLPSQGQIFPQTSYCYVAGWGILSYRQHLRSNQLRDARMQLWTESRCSANTIVLETVVNTNSTLCAGYLFGKPTACQGDSGSPLMCLNSVSGRYILAGVVSRGSNLCGKPQPLTYGNRFAKVAMAVTWIEDSMR